LGVGRGSRAETGLTEPSADPLGPALRRGHPPIPSGATFRGVHRRSPTRPGPSAGYNPGTPADRSHHVRTVPPISRRGATVMKGVILAGGTGSRLHPLTAVVSKHLLPVHDKPMIFYPLATLLEGGISEVLVISTPRDLPAYRTLLGDGTRLGIRIGYAVQNRPSGIAEGVLLAEEFCAGEPMALILGDNVFHGPIGLDLVHSGFAEGDGAVVWGFPVPDPERFGVVALDERGTPVELAEKPENPRSNLAVTGLYVLDRTAPERVRALSPSRRGELEITDLNRAYLRDGALRVVDLTSAGDVTWLDAGTPTALLSASTTIATLEGYEGRPIGCPEEVAWRRGHIDDTGLARAAADLPPGPYRDRLEALLTLDLTHPRSIPAQRAPDDHQTGTDPRSPDLYPPNAPLTTTKRAQIREGWGGQRSSR